MNNTNDLSWATQIAQFRFALIAPVVQGLFPDASKLVSKNTVCNFMYTYKNKCQTTCFNDLA